MAMTNNDVLRMAQEAHVTSIRLQFTDIFGAMKNVTVAVEQLERVLNNEMMFDGSSIEGMVRIEESDMLLYPDPNSFVILPWITGEPVGRLICDVHNIDSTPFAGDPRQILKKVISEADSMGFRCCVGPEAEFFLFRTHEDGSPTTHTHDKAQYFDMEHVDKGEDARRDMVSVLKRMGFEIEASHHESAPGQHEIDFKYSDALTTADNIMTFKSVVKVIAQQHGLHATFMPKPVYGIAGSGMHVNLSLFAGANNAFADAKDEYGLSTTAYQFIAGVLQHAAGMTAITNPLVNSYKRLVPGHEAPVYIAWAIHNRSPLIRVPSTRGTSTRIELRHPDPSCNPYLALALALRAGLDGVRRKLTPPSAVNTNLYELDEAERDDLDIHRLPRNLGDAVKALQADALLVDTLGSHVTERYTTAKRLEYLDYRTRVTPWEIEHYLGRY